MIIRGIIDRFEEDHAIIEMEGLMRQVKRADLPEDAREGDALVFIDAENKWQIDPEIAGRSKDEIKKLAEEVWE